MQLITADYNDIAENGSLRSTYIMYQLSFYELGLKLAVIRSGQKHEEHPNKQPTKQHPDSSAISASSLIWLDFSWTSAGLGWAGLV